MRRFIPPTGNTNHPRAPENSLRMQFFFLFCRPVFPITFRSPLTSYLQNSHHQHRATGPQHRKHDQQPEEPRRGPRVHARLRAHTPLQGHHQGTQEAQGGVQLRGWR